MAWLERRTGDMLKRMSTFDGLKIRDDPEAIFQEGRFLCDVGEYERGLGLVQRAVAKGYWVVPTLRGSREFEPIRTNATFEQIVENAEVHRQRALQAFREAGGERLLGRGLAPLA